MVERAATAGSVASLGDEVCEGGDREGYSVFSEENGLRGT